MDHHEQEQIRQMFADVLGVELDQVQAIMQAIMQAIEQSIETSPVVLGEPEATEYLNEVVQAMYPTPIALRQ